VKRLLLILAFSLAGQVHGQDQDSVFTGRHCDRRLTDLRVAARRFP
jgi:hypothetical protein